MGWHAAGAMRIESRLDDMLKVYEKRVNVKSESGKKETTTAEALEKM